MRIGILTQRLFTNYGGLMQSLALQTVLERLGNEVMIFNREYNEKEMFSAWNRLRRKFRVLVSNVCKKCLGLPISRGITESEEKIIRQFTNKFIERYHHSSRNLYTSLQLKASISEWKPDAIVVGSDQVWRPVYSPMISNYFLDFAQGWNVRRIAYAASFGVNDWEFTPNETKQCSDLLKLFDAVSVRENSGVSLCKEHLGVDAKHVLDPTLLLDKDFYIDIVHKEHQQVVSGDLFCYLLDIDDTKRQIIREVSGFTCMSAFYCMPKLPITSENVKNHIVQCIYPSPAKWIRSFMDAQMVLTDSFHGAVFSIIFNKPFWVLCNEGRGAARFDSLLEVFGLKERMIDVQHINEINWVETIDWGRVNAIREEKKRESMLFLKSALGIFPQVKSKGQSQRAS